MTILRDFYEHILWYTLSPLDPSCLVKGMNEENTITFSADDLQALFMPSVSANDDMSVIAAYYAETNRYRIGFRTLIHKQYAACWFHPEDGSYTLIRDNIRPVDGVWFAPAKPAEGDVILLLTANSNEIG